MFTGNITSKNPVLMDELSKLPFQKVEYSYSWSDRYITVETDIDTFLQNQDSVFAFIDDNNTLHLYIVIKTSYDIFIKNSEIFRSVMAHPKFLNNNWHDYTLTINIDELVDTSIRNFSSYYQFYWRDIAIKNVNGIDCIFEEFMIHKILESYGDLILNQNFTHDTNVVAYNNSFIDPYPIPGEFPPGIDDYKTFDRQDGTPEVLDITDIYGYSANVIQIHWRKIIADPTYLICRNRLMKEFIDLSYENA